MTSHSTPFDSKKAQQSYNPSAASPQGPFHANRPRDHPKITQGHQPGRKSSPTEFIPIFHAQTLPAGTAPPDRTFSPNSVENVVGDSIFPIGLEGMPGATSADVYAVKGYPGRSMRTVEQRNNGQGGKKSERLGLAKFATSTNPGASIELGGANPRIDPRQRGLGKEMLMRQGNRGEQGADVQPKSQA